ncbi:hypothetical protein ES707_11934 [subsurface metagenome]
MAPPFPRPVAAAPDVEVTFPDVNLEAVIRAAIGEPLGDIYDVDLLPLTTLDGTGKGIIDLAGLEYCVNLTHLFLSNNEISGISFLQSLTNLTYLSLYRNEIRGISSLQSLTNLTYLNLSDNEVSDISLLENLINLTRLSLSNNQISDISLLENLINLTDLYLSNNQISDISPLENLINLTRLSLSNNQINDISTLQDLTDLTRLSLSNNQIIDISPLKKLTDLTGLYLGSNEISDIPLFEDPTNLTGLSLSGNEIIDISPLKKLTNLTRLSLSGNEIIDISPLKDLTNLTSLSLSNNQISDISPLENLTDLTYLNINNNQISDIQPLVDNVGLAAGDTLYLDGNPLNSDSIDSLTTALGARGITVYYIPADIEVVPLTLVFGEVELGTATTLSVTISNVGNADLTVTDISLAPAGSGQFSITLTPTFPLVLPVGVDAEAEITFIPSEVGSFSAILQITSDDPDEPLVEVTLSGTGVYAGLPPSEQIAKILDFFESSVDNDSLVGDGPGKSAEHRLNALRNMLEAAGNYIEQGSMGKACQQLLNAYHKIDGQSKPPDFVTGDATPHLASLIQDLIDTLWCSQ